MTAAVAKALLARLQLCSYSTGLSRSCHHVDKAGGNAIRRARAEQMSAAGSQAQEPPALVQLTELEFYLKVWTRCSESRPVFTGELKWCWELVIV